MLLVFFDPHKREHLPLTSENLPLGGGGLLFFGIDDTLCFAKRLEKNG